MRRGGMDDERRRDGRGKEEGWTRRGGGMDEEKEGWMRGGGMGEERRRRDG